MKKILSFCLAFAICLSVLPISSLEVCAAEDDEEQSETTYEVYNGFGELQFTASSIEEVEYRLNGNSDPNSRSLEGFIKLCKFGAKYIGTVGTILTVIDFIYTTVAYANGEADFIDIIDTIVPYSTLQSLISSGKRGYLYGKDAGPNPYPPHSYQGAMWIKSQTYYVIESN